MEHRHQFNLKIVPMKFFAFFTLFVCAILALASGGEVYYRQVRSPVPVQDAAPAPGHHHHHHKHYGYGYGYH
uniref:SFRICE_039012 n=1 Tax=Spodoptera frugiperda TaxID=7108 RepID=A0A2H1VTG7_SPOFR